MRIPTEHFCATPVFALTPTMVEPEKEPTAAFTSLNISNLTNNRERKLSQGGLTNKSVGSEPNSPNSKRKLPTISGNLEEEKSPNEDDSLSKRISRYATLPKK